MVARAAHASARLELTIHIDVFITEVRFVAAITLRRPAHHSVHGIVGIVPINMPPKNPPRLDSWCREPRHDASSPGVLRLKSTWLLDWQLAKADTITYDSLRSITNGSDSHDVLERRGRLSIAHVQKTARADDMGAKGELG